MMRFNFPPLLILLSLSFPNSGETMDDLVKRGDIYYTKFADVPFTGKLEGEYQRSFEDGLRDGPWITYYDDGQLRFKGSFKDAKKEGSWADYFSDELVFWDLTGTFKNSLKISD